MLEGVADLRLPLLNDATQAWVELEYQHARHRETGEPPLTRFLAGPDVLRPSPPPDDLRTAFMTEQTRTQRRSDGTRAPSRASASRCRRRTHTCGS
jgi:hypothetical protein